MLKKYYDLLMLYAVNILSFLLPSDLAEKGAAKYAELEAYLRIWALVATIIYTVFRIVVEILKQINKRGNENK